MPWPHSSHHHGQGPRPTTGKRYGIGGFRGMNPVPQSSQIVERDHKVPIVNQNRGICNSNKILKNATQSGNRLKRVSGNIGSLQRNVSMEIDTEIQHDIEGKSKAWQYLEKWQHKTNTPRDSFKSEMDQERLRSSGQNIHSREANSARKDDANMIKNKMIFNKRNAFPGQHSSSHMNSREVSYMHERVQLPQQGKRQLPQQGNRQLPQQGNRQLPQQGNRQLPQQGNRQLPQQGNRQLPQQGKIQLPQQGKRQLPQQGKRQLPQQGKRREISPRHSSDNLNSPVTLNTNMNLSKYGMSSSIENISTSLRNKISRDSAILNRYSGNNNHRSLSPGGSNVRYQLVKESEEEKNYKLHRSYSTEREGLPDRDYSRNRDHSPETEIIFYSKGQPIVQHTSRHSLHHRSPTSERQHSRNGNYSPEIDRSPPRPQSPELNIHHHLQTSERQHSSYKRYSPDFEVTTSRAQSPEPSIQYHIPTSEREHSRYRHFSPEVDESPSRIQSLERRLRHQSPTSDGHHSRHRRHSLEFDISPPREQSPEPRLFLRQKSPSQEIFRSFKNSPPRDYEQTKSHSFARSLASMKVYKDMLLRDDLPKKGRSPTRQHKPELSGMRNLPKEYNARAFKRQRSLSPGSYRVKLALTRGRSQERILEHKFHRRLSPNEHVLKRASSPAGNMASRRLCVSSRSPDQHSEELSRLSPHSFLQNMNALHKEYSPVLIKDREEDDGYRSREKSRTSSLERQLSNKRYRGEDQHKSRAKPDDGSERYTDSHVLEKDSYSRRKPLSERLGAVFESDSEEESITNISSQEENEDKEDLRNELLRIKEKKVDEKLRVVEEKERDTDIKLRILEKELVRKEHEDSSAKNLKNSCNSRFSGINNFSRIEDNQPRNPKSSMMRKVYSGDMNSGKYHSGMSTDMYPHSQKRELTSVRQPTKTYLHSQNRRLTTAVSVKQSNDASLRIQKRRLITASSVKQSTGASFHPQKKKIIAASSVRQSTVASLHPQKRKLITASSVKQSTVTSLQSRKRKPIAAASVKQSRSLVQKKGVLPLKKQSTSKKDSLPLNEPKAFSPVRW